MLVEGAKVVTSTSLAMPLSLKMTPVKQHLSSAVLCSHIGKFLLACKTQKAAIEATLTHKAQAKMLHSTGFAEFQTCHHALTAV